jgi:hypothetical protein
MVLQCGGGVYSNAIGGIVMFEQSINDAYLHHIIAFPDFHPPGFDTIFPPCDDAGVLSIEEPTSKSEAR